MLLNVFLLSLSRVKVIANSSTRYASSRDSAVLHFGMFRLETRQNEEHSIPLLAVLSFAVLSEKHCY